MQNLTSEQTEEVDARKKAFMLAYGLLRDEYQIDSIAYPALVPNQKDCLWSRYSTPLWI